MSSMEKESLKNEEIFFKPWIGPNYKSGVNGLKTMVLG